MVVSAMRRLCSLREAANSAALVWFNRSEDIRRIDEQLGEMPSGPDLRKGAAEAVAGLVSTIKQKTLRVAEADIALVELEKIIAENLVDQVADALAAELDKLDQITIDGAPLMARATTAVSDLDNRIMGRVELDEQISKCLLALGVPDGTAASLVLSSSEIEELGQAAQSVLTAQGEVRAAREASAFATSQQGEAPPEPQDLSQLQAAWDAWQTVADVTVEQSTLATETARLAMAVAGLPNDWATLVGAGLPTRETLIDVAKKVPAVDADLALAKADCAKRAAEYALAHAKRKADEAAPTAIDINVTTQARRLRVEKWMAHRTVMSSLTWEADLALVCDNARRLGTRFVNQREGHGAAQN
jgi:chromosome segregation protein